MIILNCGRLLRVTWTSKRSNQSILKEINPEYSLEVLILKPKLQYFGHLMQSTNSLEKTLMSGKIEGKRRREWHFEMGGWHYWLNGHEFVQTLRDSEGQPGVLQSMGLQSQTQLRNWRTSWQTNVWLKNKTIQFSNFIFQKPCCEYSMDQIH